MFWPRNQLTRFSNLSASWIGKAKRYRLPFIKCSQNLGKSNIAISAFWLCWHMTYNATGLPLLSQLSTKCWKMFEEVSNKMYTARTKEGWQQSSISENYISIDYWALELSLILCGPLWPLGIVGSSCYPFNRILMSLQLTLDLYRIKWCRSTCLMTFFAYALCVFYLTLVECASIVGHKRKSLTISWHSFRWDF